MVATSAISVQTTPQPAFRLDFAHPGVGVRRVLAGARAVRHLIEAVLRCHRSDPDRLEQNVVACIAGHASPHSAMVLFGHRPLQYRLDRQPWPQRLRETTPPQSPAMSPTASPIPNRFRCRYPKAGFSVDNRDYSTRGPSTMPASRAWSAVKRSISRAKVSRSVRASARMRALSWAKASRSARASARISA